MDEFTDIKKSKNLSLFAVRIFVFAIIVIGVIFLKNSNRYLFDDLKYRYSETFGEEKYSSENIKSKSLEILSKIEYKYLEIIKNFN